MFTVTAATWLRYRSLKLTLSSTLSATEEAGAGNHPPHSNKRTPAFTHQEHPVCDVPLPGGTIRNLLQMDYFTFYYPESLSYCVLKTTVLSLD